MSPTHPVLDRFPFLEKSNPYVYTSSRIYQIKQTAAGFKVYFKKKNAISAQATLMKVSSNISLSIK